MGAESGHEEKVGHKIGDEEQVPSTHWKDEGGQAVEAVREDSVEVSGRQSSPNAVEYLKKEGEHDNGVMHKSSHLPS